MNDHSSGIKLGTAFAFLVSLLVGVGWLGLSRMSRINADLKDLLDRYVAKVQLVDQVASYTNINYRLTMQLLIINRKKDIQELLSRRAENENKIADVFTKIKSRIDTAEERELATKLESTRGEALNVVHRALDLLNRGKLAEARQLMAGAAASPLTNYMEALDAFVQLEHNQMERAQDQSETSYLAARQAAGGLIMAAIIVAIGIAGSVTRRVIRYDQQREETKADVRKLNEDLENKVVQRTEDLARAIQNLESEIAARRDREEDLQGSKMELANAQRIAHMGSFRQELTNLDDIESNSLHWSDEVIRIFGYEPGQIELSPTKFLQAVHPDDRDGVRQAYRMAIKDKQPYSREYRIILPNGTERIVHGQSDIICHPETGRPLRTVGTVQDITEWKKAEERFYKAFHANPLPITIATISEGRYLDANGAFFRVTGHQREAVIGRTSMELGFWGRTEDRAKLVEMLKDQGSVRDMEITFCTSSGDLRTGLNSAEVIEISGQKCILAIFKDVTEQKLLEQQLRQAQKMEAVGLLSGGIAHDFNNLLGVILGYSEILEMSLDQGSKLRKNAEAIKKAGQRAASLTRQLLAFSRQQVLEPKVMSLNTVVADTEEMLRRLIGEHIELTTGLAPDLGEVKADPGQIAQVLINLAVNARDAMPEGGKLIIETQNIQLDEEYALRHPPTVPGDYVMLTATDTGVGMDAQTQARIFEPFFTTKELGKGTGLGLATVYGVVKQSGGYIWVYSEPGLGATFRVYLPRVDAAVPGARPSEIVPGAFRGSETILLVEDEGSLRTLTRTLLEESGYTVLEADGGNQAMEVARQHPGPIHLLLTDMVMPGMNGRAVAEKLMSARPDLRVIYMSGYAGFSPNSALDSDTIFLSKPITRDALLRKLNEVLSLQKEPMAS